MNNAEVLKEINQVGENFGEMMSCLPTNYVNGYMQAVRDCKVPFYGQDIFADSNKMVVTNADRIRNMSDKDLAIFLEAVECNSHGWCDECETLKGNPCNGLKDESNALVKERLDWLKEKVEL